MAIGAKKKQDTNVKSIELKLLTTGTSSPIHRIEFFGVGDIGAKDAMREVTDWYDTILVLMKAATGDRAVNVDSVVPNNGNLSQADEIRKLNGLHTVSLITQAEYERAKAKLF